VVGKLEEAEVEVLSELVSATTAKKREMAHRGRTADRSAISLTYTGSSSLST
jgi:hypothetical protein